MHCLSKADGASLLQLAQAAVREAVTNGKLPSQIPLQGVFAEHRGVFVTLRIAGRLRGCIGTIEGREALGDAVAHCAVGAALQDPRFSPVRPDELPALQAEISVLSPLAPTRPADVVIGRDGLFIIARGKQGLLLPQVAVEHRLDREQFLAETCQKAGLPWDAWREPQTRVFTFTCEVFSEGDSGPV